MSEDLAIINYVMKILTSNMKNNMKINIKVI